jgi:hypothetical protein
VDWAQELSPPTAAGASAPTRVTDAGRPWAPYGETLVRRDGGAEFAIDYEILELVEPELIVLRSDPMPHLGMHEPPGRARGSSTTTAPRCA